jgi:hypothetical protein
VRDVVGIMRSFHRISKALISRLDRDEARAPTPLEVPSCVLVGIGSIHRELEKVKFLKSFGAPDSASIEVGEYGDVIFTS